jgi:hypothetical protein
VTVQLSTENATLLAQIGVKNALKARAAWEQAQESAYEMAKLAINAGADPDEIIRPLNDVLGSDHLGELAMLGNYVQDQQMVATG